MLFIFSFFWFGTWCSQSYFWTLGTRVKKFPKTNEIRLLKNDRTVFRYVFETECPDHIWPFIYATRSFLAEGRVWQILMLILAYARNNWMRFLVMIGFYDCVVHNYSRKLFLLKICVCCWRMHVLFASVFGFIVWIWLQKRCTLEKSWQRAFAYNRVSSYWYGSDPVRLTGR